MKSGNPRQNSTIRSNRLMFAGFLLIAAAAASLPLYSVSSASLRRATEKSDRNVSSANTERTRLSLPTVRNSLAFGTFFGMPPAPPTLQTFESPGCTNPKVSFDLGQTVCAKIVGAPQPFNGRASAKIGWVSPYGSLAQGADISSDPQTGTYIIPAAATQTFTDVGGGTVTVDNRGVWTLGLYSTADGSQIATTDFTVHDPAKAYVDLSVPQSLTANDFQVF